MSELSEDFLQYLTPSGVSADLMGDVYERLIRRYSSGGDEPGARGLSAHGRHLSRAADFVRDLLVPDSRWVLVGGLAHFHEISRALCDHFADSLRIGGALLRVKDPEEAPTQEFHPGVFHPPTAELASVDDADFVRLRTQCWYWLCWLGETSDAQRSMAAKGAAGVLDRRLRQIRQLIARVAERIVARLEGLGRQVGRHLSSYLQALYGMPWGTHAAEKPPPLSRVVRLFRTSLVGTLTRNAPPVPA